MEEQVVVGQQVGGAASGHVMARPRLRRPAPGLLQPELQCCTARPGGAGAGSKGQGAGSRGAGEQGSRGVGGSGEGALVLTISRRESKHK